MEVGIGAQNWNLGSTLLLRLAWKYGNVMSAFSSAQRNIGDTGVVHFPFVLSLLLRK